jgi:hypothetical protein
MEQSNLMPMPFALYFLAFSVLPFVFRAADNWHEKRHAMFASTNREGPDSRDKLLGTPDASAVELIVSV